MSDFLGSVSARSTGRAAPLVAFGLLYFVLCWSGEQLMLASALGVAIWPPSGLLLVMLLRHAKSERRALLAVAVTADLAASLLLFSFPLAVALPVALGNALEASVGSLLLRRAATLEIVDVRSALRFVVLAGLVAPLFSMSFGATAVGLHTGTPLLESWRLWWTGDALGILVVGPLVLSIGSDAWRRLLAAGPFRHAEFVALLLVVMVGGYVSLALPYPIAFITLPPIIWAALRHGVAGSSVAVGLTVTQAVVYAMQGRGPFVGGLALGETQLVVQTFGIVIAMTSLLLAGSAIQERRAKQLAEALVMVRTNELRQREAQLEHALQELRTVDARKDNFLSVLAHELLNPIATLRNGLEVLDRDIAPDRSANVRRMMRRQSDQLVLITADLFDLARIKAGKVRLNVTLLAVSDMAQSAIDSVADLFDRKHQTLVSQLPPGDTTLHGDKTRLQQVLVNLLSNASRHCPEGAFIRLRVEATGDEVIFEVEDDGPGIPPDRLESIFGLYEQAAGYHGQGLGIGLALVRQIVDLHGGRIDVASVVGKGTTFRLRLRR